MNDIQETIQEIDKIRDALYRNKLWNDGEVLSQAIVKLAALNSFLGEFVAQAELDSNSAESLYKATREAQKLDLLKDTENKTTVAQAEAQALVDTVELLDNANKLNYQAQLLKMKRTDTNNLIDACRSRLSFMRQERVNS